MKNGELIRAESICKSFGATQALIQVDIELFPGEIHGLVGENGAGKSTLINILSGVFPPDTGQIFFKRKRVSFKNPRQAQMAGIGSVHQELALCPAISVAENIFMGQDGKGRWGLVNYSDLYHNASQLLEKFHARINPRHKAGLLTVAQQQVVEIVKALSFDCKVLILDEPTSSLTDNETATLFEIIKKLKSQQISILYVSHRMTEIFDLCDRVTIFRDGRHIDTLEISQVDPQAVIDKMVGRKISNMYPKKRKQQDEVLLEVRNLSKDGAYSPINFELRQGEVLGFSGLVGAGRTELARGICRIDEVDTGEVFLKGKKLKFKDYEPVIKEGLVYLPEDRKIAGLFLGLSIQQNISSAALNSISRRGFLNQKAERKLGGNFSKQLNIRLRNLNQLARELSGGNQQKTMVAKWLATKPSVIIMDEPTRGIDVGAKSEIYALINNLVCSGIGVIMISSDLPEIIGMCDRVIVMYEGHYQGTVTVNDITESKIMTLASPHTHGNNQKGDGACSR